jgi:hypothetical protein
MKDRRQKLLILRAKKYNLLNQSKTNPLYFTRTNPPYWYQQIPTWKRRILFLFFDGECNVHGLWWYLPRSRILPILYEVSAGLPRIVPKYAPLVLLAPCDVSSSMNPDPTGYRSSSVVLCTRDWDFVLRELHTASELAVFLRTRHQLFYLSWCSLVLPPFLGCSAPCSSLIGDSTVHIIADYPPQAPLWPTYVVHI